MRISPGNDDGVYTTRKNKAQIWWAQFVSTRRLLFFCTQLLKTTLFSVTSLRVFDIFVSAQIFKQLFSETLYVLCVLLRCFYITRSKKLVLRPPWSVSTRHYFLDAKTTSMQEVTCLSFFRAISIGASHKFDAHPERYCFFFSIISMYIARISRITFSSSGKFSIDTFLFSHAIF